MVLHIASQFRPSLLAEDLNSQGHSSDLGTASPEASLDQYIPQSLQHEIFSNRSLTDSERVLLLRRAELLKSAGLLLLSSTAPELAPRLGKLQEAIGLALLKHRENPRLDLVTEVGEALMQIHEVELAGFWAREVTQRWGTELRLLVTADQQNFSSRLQQSIQNLLAQANPIGQSFLRVIHQGRALLQGQGNIQGLKHSTFALSALAYAAFRTSLSDWTHRLQLLQRQGLSQCLESLVYEEAPRESELNFSLAERWMQIFHEQEGERAFSHLQDQLQGSVDHYQIVQSARRMSLLGGSAQDLISSFLNQGGSLSSSFLASMLARPGANPEGFLLSLLGGAVIGSFQGAGSFAMQWANLRAEERQEHLPQLLWEFTKSVGVGLGSAVGGYSFGCFLGGASHSGLGALAHFWLADVGVEVLTQKLLEKFGQARHWEEASVIQGSWLGELIVNGIEESVGNRQGNSLQLAMHVTAMGVTLSSAAVLTRWREWSTPVSPVKTGAHFYSESKWFPVFTGTTLQNFARQTFQSALSVYQHTLENVKTWLGNHSLSVAGVGLVFSLGFQHFFAASNSTILQAGFAEDLLSFFIAGNAYTFVTEFLKNTKEIDNAYLALFESGEDIKIRAALFVFAEVSECLSEEQNRVLAGHLRRLKEDEKYSDSIEKGLLKASAKLKEFMEEQDPVQNEIWLKAPESISYSPEAEEIWQQITPRLEAAIDPNLSKEEVLRNRVPLEEVDRLLPEQAQAFAALVPGATCCKIPAQNLLKDFGQEQNTLSTDQQNLWDDLGVSEEDFALEFTFPCAHLLYGSNENGNLKPIDVHHALTLIQANLNNNFYLVRVEEGRLIFRVPAYALQEKMLRAIHGENAPVLLPLGRKCTRSERIKLFSSGIAPIGLFRGKTFLEDIETEVDPFFFGLLHDGYHANKMARFSKFNRNFIYILYRLGEELASQYPAFEVCLDRLSDLDPGRNTYTDDVLNFFFWSLGALLETKETDEEIENCLRAYSRKINSFIERIKSPGLEHFYGECIKIVNHYIHVLHKRKAIKATPLETLSEMLGADFVRQASESLNSFHPQTSIEIQGYSANDSYLSLLPSERNPKAVYWVHSVSILNTGAESHRWALHCDALEEGTGLPFAFQMHYVIDTNSENKISLRLNPLQVNPHLSLSDAQVFEAALSALSQRYPSLALISDVEDFSTLFLFANNKCITDLELESQEEVRPNLSPSFEFLKAFASEKTNLCTPEERDAFFDLQKLPVTRHYAKMVEILNREYASARASSQDQSRNVLLFLLKRLQSHWEELAASPLGVFFLSAKLRGEAPLPEPKISSHDLLVAQFTAREQLSLLRAEDTASPKLENLMTQAMPQVQSLDELQALQKQIEAAVETRLFLYECEENILNTPDSDTLSEDKNEQYKEIVAVALKQGRTEGVTAELSDLLRETYVEELKESRLEFVELDFMEVLESFENQKRITDNQKIFEKIKAHFAGRKLKVYRGIKNKEVDLQGAHLIQVTNHYNNDHLKHLFCPQKPTELPEEVTFDLLPGEVLEFLEDLQEKTKRKFTVRELLSEDVLTYVKAKSWPVHLSREASYAHGHLNHPWYNRNHDTFHIIRRNSHPERDLEVRNVLAEVAFSQLHQFQRLRGEMLYSLEHLESIERCNEEIGNIYEGAYAANYGIRNLRNIYSLLKWSKGFGSVVADAWLRGFILELRKSLKPFRLFFQVLQDLYPAFEVLQDSQKNEECFWSSLQSIHPDDLEEDDISICYEIFNGSHYLFAPELEYTKSAFETAIQKKQRQQLLQDFSNHILHSIVVRLYQLQQNETKPSQEVLVEEINRLREAGEGEDLYNLLELKYKELLLRIEQKQERVYRIQGEDKKIRIIKDEFSLETLHETYADGKILWRVPLNRSRQRLEAGQINKSGEFVPLKPRRILHLEDTHLYPAGQILEIEIK